jgi:hypothetical protein
MCRRFSISGRIGRFLRGSEEGSHAGKVKDKVQGPIGGTKAALCVMVGRLQTPQALSHSFTNHAGHAPQVLQHNLQEEGRFGHISDFDYKQPY